MSDGTLQENQEPKEGRRWTDDELAMLDSLRAGDTHDTAAGKMGLSYAGLYSRREKDKELDDAINAAHLIGKKAQAAKIARAIYSGAAKCGDDPRFTTQAIFAMKNLDPQNWRDSHEISGPGGGAIPIQIVMFGSPAPAPDDDDTNGDPAAGI